MSVIGEVAPCSFVNDTVNVVDGSLYLRMHHLTVPGHVPLDLVQFYHNKSSYDPWFGVGMSFNYSFAAWDTEPGDRTDDKYERYNETIAESAGGSIIRCLGSAKPGKKADYYLDPKVIHEGFTNCGSGCISARTNLKNIRFRQSTDHYGYSDWTCYLPDGSERFYHVVYNKPLTHVYLEKRLNKTSLEFDYNSYTEYGRGVKYKRVESIKKIKAKAKHQFNCLKFFRHEHHASVTSSNYGWVNFKGFTKDNNLYIHKIESSENPTQEFEYTHAGKYYCIDKIKYPQGRFLEMEYDHKGRVTAQKAPVSPNGEKHTIWRFDYRDDHTVVHDANDHKTVYNHKDNRITSVDEFRAGSLYRSKAYFWGAKEGLSWGKPIKSDEGNLMGYATLNHDGRGESLCYYEYDDFGNITKETLCGNLSGTYTKPFWIDGKGRSKDANVEKYHKYYKYSKDHLLIEQREDFGPKIEWRYINGTDLPWAKYVFDDETLIQREFYNYDSDGILVEKILDDGSTTNKSSFIGVTQRLVTHIIPITDKEGYGQGLPKEVWENYQDLETKELVVLKHTRFNYNKQSQVTEEAVFDANNKYHYSIKYQYDDKSRLHKKTNPMGETFTYSYDANNNRTYEKQEGVEAHTNYEYDKANRLISAVEYHYGDSEVHNSFAYDFAGNKVAATDRYGNKTTYDYDSFNRVKKITFADGTAIHKEYDIFDNLTKEINQNGHATSYEYTIRNSPSHITYPDGSEERFHYNHNGTLAYKIDQNGIKTSYTYDLLGRVTKTAIFDSSGNELSTSTNRYNTFHLLATCDPMGFTTHYRYDAAGRKVEEWQEAGDAFSKTTYEYDALGRLSCTKRYYDQSGFIATRFTYDLLNRVTLEKQQDVTGATISWNYYKYDALGNRTLVRSGHLSEDAEIKSLFNTKGELIQHIDECGSATKIAYDHTFINKNGKKSLKKTTTDALGNITKEYFDVMGRLVSTVRKNSSGKLLAATDFCYNATGKKTKQIEHVLIDGQIHHDYIIAWEYDSLDRIIKLIEQPDTHEEKSTSYAYDPSGRLVALTKPDGTTLNHSYDGLGRLTNLTSSDGTVAYSYFYDLHNNPVEVKDEVSGHSSLYTYDLWNRTLSDGLKGKHSQSYTYDCLGRLLTLTTPDNSQVSYSYDTAYLRTISWKGFEHQYNGFDLKGCPRESTLIGQAGPLSQSWDKKCRITNITHPYFSQDIPSDGFDPVGNLKKFSFTDPMGHIDATAAYDDLYQLTEEVAVKTHTYTHDSISNRLSKDRASYSIDGRNMLLSTSEDAFIYDKNGNLLEQRSPVKTLRFAYDALDRLIKVSDGSQEVTYFYDNFHRRIAKCVNGEQHKYYIYLGQREVGFYDPAAQELLEYRILGLGKGAELGASIAIELQGKIYAPIHDHRGNIVCLLDPETGLPQETYRYTAFGESETYSADKPINNPWGFMSKRHDPETGFVYFSRRYYAPATGRWITPDPLGFADGPNMYAYVHNNPLTGFDLYGLWDENIDYDDDTTPDVRFFKAFIAQYTSNQLAAVGHIGRVGMEFTQHPITTTQNMFESVQNLSISSVCNTIIATKDAVVDLYSENDWCTASGVVVAELMPGVEKGTRLLGKVLSQKIGRVAKTALNETKQIRGSGRAKNKMKPHQQTPRESTPPGTHSVFKKDHNGKTTHYTTWKVNTNPHPLDPNPSPFKMHKEYHGTGKEPQGHFMKQYDRDSGYPHVHRNQRNPKTGKMEEIVEHPHKWEMPK